MDKQKVVVHIDDDPDDQLFVKNAIHDYDSTITHLPFQEGEKALKYLNLSIDCGRIPMLVLLDINMPGMDGRMLLKELKTNERLTSIPVVLFTTSSSALDKLFAKTFSVPLVTKPDSALEIKKIIQSLIASAM